MQPSTPIDFESAVNAIRSASSKQGLVELMEVIDERYLSDDLHMEDSKWPLLNKALFSRLNELH